MFNRHFDDEDDFTRAAQSCKLFSAKPGLGKKGIVEEGISCKICNYWDGFSCIKKADSFIQKEPDYD